MTFATSHSLQSANREEREAKIREFVTTALVVHRAKGASEPMIISLLARGPDSPAARALASMADELIAANVTVTAVLLDLDTFTDEPGRASVLDMANADVRLLSDPRFASAHEQMVLGASIMWLGDCMRRDPAKRDAFELFHHDDAQATANATVSFRRLQAIAQDVRRVRSLAPQMMVSGSFAEPLPVTLTRR
ncbi:MAG: hypothetical protein AB7S74_08585 [Hyphomicrobium sp.]